MTGYLSYTFQDSEDLVSTFDEVPLWSASFGLLLLKHVELRPNMKVIDIGSGTGFPLLELAERLGPSCKLYGIDPWTNATQRARQKIKSYGLSNVEIIESSAENIPFEENSIDLVVSNLGINNFENPPVVFKASHRVLKQRGVLALTTNLQGHWHEFYAIFYATLSELKKEKFIPALKQDEDRRGNLASVSKLFTDSGFKVVRRFEESFTMRFLNGSAFLDHHFIKLGWLTGWMNMFPKEELPEIFAALERNLNAWAEKNNGLTLTVPMAYVEGIKI